MRFVDTALAAPIIGRRVNRVCRCERRVVGGGTASERVATLFRPHSARAPHRCRLCRVAAELADVKQATYGALSTLPCVIEWA